MEKSGYEYDNKYDWVELLNKKLEEQNKESTLSI